MEELTVNHMRLQLLPQKAIYVEALEALLVSDVHLGKSETFQQFGVPIPSQVNRATLQRLQALCDQYHPAICGFSAIYSTRAGAWPTR
jgi:metallophosphoesterase superfamily enzyme